MILDPVNVRIFITILLPLLPAYVLYVVIKPKSEQVPDPVGGPVPGVVPRDDVVLSGPLQGMNVKARGAVAAYFIGVLLISVAYPVLQTASSPLPPEEVWEVEGDFKWETERRPRAQIKPLVSPPSERMDTRSYRIPIIVSRREQRLSYPTSIVFVVDPEQDETPNGSAEVIWRIDEVNIEDLINNKKATINPDTKKIRITEPRIGTFTRTEVPYDSTQQLLSPQ